MKIRFHLFILSLCAATLAFTACKNSVDSGSDPDLFDSPKSVLNAIDNDMSMASIGSRSARTITEPDYPIAVSDLSKTYESEVEYRRLTGDVSTTAAIIAILKDIGESRADGLKFNTLYSDESFFTATKFIEKGNVDIVVKKLEMKSPNENGEVYVYSSGTAAPTGIAYPYKFSLKLTKNSIGSLDSELYMVMTITTTQGSMEIPNYYKLSCTTTEKVKHDYSITWENQYYWVEVTVKADGISGYKYTKGIGNTTADDDYRVGYVTDKNYCAKYNMGYDRTNTQRWSNIVISKLSTAETLAKKDLNTAASPEWAYNVAWLNLPAGYKIKKTNDNDFYLMTDADTDYNESKRVFREEGMVNVNGVAPDRNNAYWYALLDDDTHSIDGRRAGSYCSLTLPDLDSSVTTHFNNGASKFNDLDSRKAEVAGATLKNLLAAWQ